MFKTMLSITLLQVLSLSAAPVLIDFDMTGRPLAEGNEPGYTQWAVSETTGSASTTVSGVTFTVSRNGGSGTAIKSYYYKAGVQTPHYARLIADALSVVGGEGGANIRVSISGLTAGNHTLQVYHNSIDGLQHGPIKVMVNGSTVLNNVTQSNRKLIVSESASSFVTFNSAAGQTVTVDYMSLKTGTNNNVFLNNLTLDLPNPAMQAKNPIPANRNWHADGDDGSVTLSWSGASAARSHDVYVGTDSQTVARATKNSSEYKGNRTSSTFEVLDVNVHQVYWWRIDEVDASSVVTAGELWSFAPRRLAFRDAEGFGRFARGGRGGKVVHVTNLNDAGAGSFREAVTNDIGPRTIVFDVSGVITLSERLTLGQSNITVAGQTAPGKGIVIRSAPFGLSGASDVIVRFMKVRLGYGRTFDGMGLQGSDHCILDHNSISWTIDEAFSSRSGKNITLQRTMIAEALNIADHQNYPSGSAHGFAATISGDTGSFHHNLLAHNEGRNWSLGGGLDGNGYYAGNLDIFNNVVYNWGGRATDGGAHQVNFVNNYYKEGPATTMHYTLNAQLEGKGLGSQSYFYRGNILQATNGSFTCDGTNNNCGRKYSLSGGQVLDWNVWPDQAFFSSHAKIQSAKDAYKDVLSDVGMTMPVLDEHDKRIVKETLEGKTTFKGSISGKAGLIDREADVGGYESYPNMTRPADFDPDGDGMPTWWEDYIGSNPNSAKGDFSESNADPDGDGYTNLEDYLDYMATPHLEVAKGNTAMFNLAALFRGYSKSPTYQVSNNTCLTTTVTDSTLRVTPQSNCGVARFTVTVRDNESSTKTRDLYVYVSGSEMPTLENTKRLIPRLNWNVTREHVTLLTNARGILDLFDMNGRQVAQVQGTGQLQMSLLNRPKGLLIARFVGEGISERRIIKVFACETRHQMRECP